MTGDLLHVCKIRADRYFVVDYGNMRLITTLGEFSLAKSKTKMSYRSKINISLHTICISALRSVVCCSNDQ